uniref:Basonuclin zinc finger protein 2 n=1 Tax=Paramormyrops kingsleyae TaxID=1676925 RepID=A0A3B3SRR3_9TELE
MQFGARPASAESGFMGTWQSGSDSTLLFRMSQQVGSARSVGASCDCGTPLHLPICELCQADKEDLSTQHLYHPTQVEIVQSNVVFDISSLMLYGTQAVPVRLKILLDRLFSVLKQEEVLHILHGLGWTLRDYVRGYILQDAAGKVLDRWTIMSREEEIITLQQFLRFGETKSIVELMAIQEKEGQAVTVPSSKTDSGIRTFIESNNRTRSPSLLTHLESSSPASSIHHFENIPNSLAFLLPFQYINPVSAPMLGLPPDGLALEPPGLRLREPGLVTQGEPLESTESEVSLSPFRGAPSPSRGGSCSVIGMVEPKAEPNSTSPAPPAPITVTHSSFSSKMHRMRRMGSTSRKGRVCCTSCGKTFYDKGTLKIHYNAVHLKIKHRCTIEGCNMVFSSLRSRNRHSANPNPRLHMPMLRNNRDKDLIRSTGSATPVISSTKSGFTLTNPGRPPLGFGTPPLDPMLQGSLVFPSLKPVQPVQPVPPFYRKLLSPVDLVSTLPTSPILPTSTNSNSLMEQQEQVPAANSHSVLGSDLGHISHSLSNPGLQDPTIDHMPKKKPRKSSMPVKIEKEVIAVADEYDDKDDDDDDSSPPRHLQEQDEYRGKGMGSELRCMDSYTSEDQDHERDFDNESETSEPKTCYRDELMEAEEQRHVSSLDREKEMEEDEDDRMRKDMDDNSLSSPSPHQPVIKIKEELSDPTYEMFCMSQYGLYNGSAGMATAAAAASMAALHESFVSSMGYGSSPPKFHSHSPDGDLCSSPDPKICYVCKKSFKSSYSVKLHYKNVHLKEMHVCTVAGCNAAFPSRRSRDRHSSNINLHRKLLTKELDDMVLDPHAPLPRDLHSEFLAKIYGRPRGFGRDDPGSPAGAEYSHGNGFCRGASDDYAVLDLSTASSVQSSGSAHSSSRESDDGSDEGILLDELEGASDGEGPGRAAAGEGGESSSSPTPLSMPGSGFGGGIVCSICHKMYSNKGTLRVHYKTVHLREMHKCKVPGCNMMFSSVRSRNRHSQNPNLHKNVPFAAIVD